MKYAIFDFDGTLSSNYISMEFLDYLHEKGQFDPKEYDHQMRILKEYKDGKMDYDKWVDEWANSWARGLRGLKRSMIGNSARNFYRSFKKNVYPESFEAVRYLKDNGYKLILLTAGDYEAADAARNSLGMDETIATRAEVEDGRYTGRMATNVHTETGKGEYINYLMKQKEYGRPVFVFGDSTGDISMLKQAKIPVALNPKPELEKYARANGWTVLTSSNLMEFLKLRHRP